MWVLAGQTTRGLYLPFQQLLKIPKRMKMPTVSEWSARIPITSKNNKREIKPVTASDLKHLRIYLQKLQIKSKNGRSWVVKKGNKGLFVEPEQCL